MKLTPKQKAFADYYIELGNATEAAQKAGYKGNNLNRIAKSEEVLAFLSKSLRGEVLEEVVSTESIDGMIKPVILKKQLSAKDRIKAAELLGKRYALFTEKVDLEGNVGVIIIDDIGTLEDE